MVKIAIIGRPNVGKSTLFNRFVGKRLALVDDQPGVTRDRREGEAHLGHLSFTAIDTAGLEDDTSDSLEGRMRAQTLQAIEDADLSLFVIDARSGITPIDEHFADLLRKHDKPVLVVANKAEGKKGEEGFYEAFTLGFGTPVPVSAEHGENFAELCVEIDSVLTRLKNEQKEETTDEVSSSRDNLDVETNIIPEQSDDAVDDAIIFEHQDKPLQVAIIGRPNAGKSTLINQILDEERMLTGPEAGITRDSISVDFEFEERALKLFDTAGIRKRARVQEKLEKLSVADGLRAIRFAEVVILLLDATCPFEKQDLNLAALVEREGRGLVIGLNKWDLVEDRHRVLNHLNLELKRLLPQLRGIQMIPLSGLYGENIEKLMRAVLQTSKIWNIRIGTSPLNRWLDGILAHHPPPAVSGRPLKIKYMTQIKARPPTFTVFCSRPDAFPESYKRYLANSLRETFDITGVPLRVQLRASDNPYAHKKRKIQ